jgi:hypothetical protein
MPISVCGSHMKFHPYLNWELTLTHEATIRESGTLSGDIDHLKL